jgi:hypothetical protein
MMLLVVVSLLSGNLNLGAKLACDFCSTFPYSSHPSSSGLSDSDPFSPFLNRYKGILG